MPPPSQSSSGAQGTPADAGRDSSKPTADAAPPPEDAGPAAPAEGVTCPVADQIFARSCGACGKQEALCLAGASGLGGVVSTYSVCHDEAGE